ncbi:MAG: metallophosphoesterase [Bacteroidota bacterium]
MRRVLKTALKVAIVLLLSLPVVLAVLVRYTDGTISGGGLIVLGYDEEAGRFQLFEEKRYDFHGVDGHYVVADSVYTVDATSTLHRRLHTSDTLLVRVDNAARDSFTVQLRDTHPPDGLVYPVPDTLLAVSDIEGNFEAFVGLLHAHGVIDASFNWRFGRGHVVLLGDFVDRGSDVLPTLWLIYRLEQQAQEARGHVHFILGNHEAMNLHGNGRYARPKYIRAALEIGGSGDRRQDLRRLFAADTELGRWLRSKAVMKKIGRDLYVHAGLSPALAANQLSLDEVNALARPHLDDPTLYSTPGDTPRAHLVMGRQGPLWYRGLVQDYKEHYTRVTPDVLSTTLAFYDAQRVVIGHTLVERVSTDFEGRVIRIDVKHGTERASPETQGLLLLGGVPYRIDALGRVEAL